MLNTCAKGKNDRAPGGCIHSRLRQAWTDHTFFFSGRFFSIWAYLVYVILHKNKSEEGKSEIVWKLARLQPSLCLKNTQIPLTCHYFIFFLANWFFLHHVCLAQEHFRGKYHSQIPIASCFFSPFFRFLPVFQVSTILQTTATNFPEVISKFCSKVL